jgi:hypothetical protein
MNDSVMRLVAAIEEFEAVRAQLAALPPEPRCGVEGELHNLEWDLLASREAAADRAVIEALCLLDVETAA